MALAEIQNRYDNNKCAKCGMELKKGWTIYYDKENKKVYCRNCKNDGENLTKQLTPVKNFTDECVMCGREIIEEDAFINLETGDVYCLECGEKANSPNAEVLTSITQLEQQISIIAGNSNLMNDMIANLDKKIDTIDGKINDLLNEFALYVASNKVEKTKKEEVKEKSS